jgi:cytochrome c oxidase cbb3-type subunit III
VKSKTSIIYIGVWILALCGSAFAQAQKRDIREFLGLGAAPDAAAAKLGEPLYKQNCEACHGVNARGGEGPSLVRSALVLHDEKGKDIGQLLKSGRPQAGMPAFPNLKTEEVYEIAEYLHQQVENAANRGSYNALYANQRNQTSGDAKQGASFFQSNCSGCHSATGDLAQVGKKYAQAAVMQPRFLWPVSKDAAKVTVKTPEGQTVTGTVVRLDDFDVKLRDSSGEYHEWDRSKVEVTSDDKLAGHRALLPKYKDSDLHNLTAYLLTLK